MDAIPDISTVLAGRGDWHPRMVATDLDGTIVRTDGSVSHRTVTALDAAREAGAEVVYVTGRPARWLPPIVEWTGHAPIAICSNGALVVDMATGQVLTERCLPGSLALEVANAVRRAAPGATFAIERAGGFGWEPSYQPGWTKPGELDGGEIAALDVLCARDVIKLLARVDGADPDELLAAACDAVGDLATCTHSSADGLLEISAAGITKAAALAEIAAERGLGPDDVVAFGDMPNDVPMLAWAGLGVAVGDAHPEARAAADAVTLRGGDDGVAVVLEHWFGRR